MTNVKCAFAMTALSSLISSMKPCKIQAVPGFVRNVNLSTSQTHSSLSNQTWRIKTDSFLKLKILKLELLQLGQKITSLSVD